MTDIIPRDLIRHLEYNPDKKVPKQEVSSPQPSNKKFSIEDILNGKTFYGNMHKPRISKYSDGEEALEAALAYAGPEGIVATMPELIAAKIYTAQFRADHSHDLWNERYTAHTEENVGIDKKGRFYSKNQPVLVIVNGGGLITPERIKSAHLDILEGHIKGGAIRYHDEEFEELLDGKLPDGSSIPLHCFEDIEKGISNLPHRFGVVIGYRWAALTHSGEHDKKAFLENPLVIARAGGPEHLETYYQETVFKNQLCNSHQLIGNERKLPNGRFIGLGHHDEGLSDKFSHHIMGRFLGVAPK